MVEPTGTKLSKRELFNISRFAIRYPWLTLGFWIAVTVAGLLAFSSLKYALFPDITFPVVVVNATAPLASALDTEAKLTQPIEQRLNKSLQKIDDIRSSSYPGQAAISVAFQVGTNLEESSRNVENALKQLALPQGATSKVIPLNLNESAAVSYAIKSQSKNLTELTAIAKEKIVPALKNLPGVLKVELLGGVNSTSPQPATGAQQDSEAAGEQAIQGASEQGSDSLGGSKSRRSRRQRNGRAGEESAGAEQQRSNGSTQMLNAGAGQQGGNPALTPGTAVRFNGQDALAFQAIKRGDANTLEVVRNVEKEVTRLQSVLPDVQLALAATQADYIREATQATIEDLWLAVALSVIIIFPFLWNWQATLISALAIPTSLLGTFIVMAALGFNLETITLLALALVIGIIIDDAIVDVENIARHLEEGEPPRQAAIAATNEIGLTVTAATFTIVAVFLPVGLMRGVLGQFFKPFGLTVSAAVITSLLVARTLSPLLAVYWLKPKHGSRDEKSGATEGAGHSTLETQQQEIFPTQPAKPSNNQWWNFVRYYRHLLSWSLFHRRIVLGIALLAFAAGIALIPLIPKGFIPKLDRGEFNVVYTAPATTSLSDSRSIAERLEDAVKKQPDVESVFTTVGSREGQANKGTLYVKLRDNRKQSTTEVEDRLRTSLPAIPGVDASVADIQFVETGGEKPLTLALVGKDLKALGESAKTIKERIEKLPGFADVTATGATKDPQGTVFEIEHLNGNRVAYVSANLGKGVAIGDATDKVVAIAKEIIPSSITLKLGGDSARAGEIFGSFGATLGLSVLCILVVLLLLFKSWSDPLVIIFSLPLSLVGALLALLFTNSNFGMISVIGIIFLLGLTNKNAILLVDYINQLRRSGLSRTEAILKAGPVRLRPILMTTAATILGMLPIALGLGAGAELRAPMAIAIIGGLLTSTILSLIVVPVVYAVLDDLYPRKLKREK